jgi:hypothetical protein
MSEDDILAALARLEAGQTAMEARLMLRINDAQEKLIERMRLNEAAVSALTEVARGTNNTMSVLTTLLSTIAGAHTDLSRRMTDIEKRSP